MNESHTAAKIRSIRSYSRQDGGAPTNPQPLFPKSVDSNPFQWPRHMRLTKGSGAGTMPVYGMTSGGVRSQDVSTDLPNTTRRIRDRP